MELRSGAVDPRPRWYRVGWALPWLLFQFFPVADLVTTDRPLAVRLVAGAGLSASRVSRASSRLVVVMVSSRTWRGGIIAQSRVDSPWSG